MAVLDKTAVKKTTTTVVCVIGKDFNTGDYNVTTKAILPTGETNAFGKGYPDVSVKCKHAVSFEALQVLASYKNMVSHLEDKGGIRFQECPCEYIYAKAQNEDRWYYAMVVDLGTPEFPFKRTFYLKPMQEHYIKLQGVDKLFVKVENEISDEAEAQE